MSTNFKVTVTGETAVVDAAGVVLTSGSKGVYTVTFTTDTLFWGGLNLEAVFIAAPPAWPTNPSARDLVRRSEPLADGSAFVHPDVLSKPGLRLWVGLQGLDTAGTIVKNSTLALVGKIQQGADPDGPGDGDIPATRYASLKETVDDISSEVVDARTGLDGTTHTSLGNAVRGQVKKLSGEIDGKNYLPTALLDEKYYINGSGELAESLYVKYRTTDLVPVEAGKTYYVAASRMGGAMFAFYDSGKTAIEVVTESSNGAIYVTDYEVVAPEGAAYIRLSTYPESPVSDDPTIYTKGTGLTDVADEVENLKERVSDLEENGTGGGSGGQPVPVSSAADMQNTSTIYLYLGDGEISESVSYEYGYIYAYDSTSEMWKSTGLYGVGEQGPQGEKGETGEQGAAGKSAYEYAQDGGYTGTEEEFAEKLAKETSGIHIGPDAPTDENIDVWIDTDEESDEESEEESSGIDVTAEVGQTIIVKAVDENGKPTEWEATDFPEAEHPDWNAAEGEAGHVLNRTHYSEWVEILPEQALEHIEGGIFLLSEDSIITVGNAYRVVWNETTYECQCRSVNGAVLVGNSLVAEGEDTGEPFCIMTVSGEGTAAFDVNVLVYGGEMTEVTASVAELQVHKLPLNYVESSIHYVDIVKADSTYTTEATPLELMSSIDAGKTLCARITVTATEDEGVTAKQVAFVPCYTYTYISSIGLCSRVSFVAAAKATNSATYAGNFNVLLSLNDDQTGYEVTGIGNDGLLV